MKQVLTAPGQTEVVETPEIAYSIVVDPGTGGSAAATLQSMMDGDWIGVAAEVTETMKAIRIEPSGGTRLTGKRRWRVDVASVPTGGSVTVYMRPTSMDDLPAA